ncbi:uncharacterized protein LOC125242693 [Leguminivora glycinivorella]|uniref:uncharacterized protein LOC125242693 n=1 Tax=Leguminivora glycinivorella TaxID=1035111 RepID=UPI00200F48E1|nr:uncharacterized protein LOC125242693 [Leguminivora glycinivorella]
MDNDKKPRVRAPNFTKSDFLLLCSTVEKHKQVIENKKTDGAQLLLKQKAWQEVMREYNSSTTGSSRTLESLQQTYKNLKKKAKKTASDKKMGIPVDSATLVLNLEEYGSDWGKVAANTGASETSCSQH